MTSRRGFLSLFAAAPAIVTASNIMRVTPVSLGEWALEQDSVIALRPTKLLVPGAFLEEALKILNEAYAKHGVPV
jgi:hypothetical protein